MGFTFTHSCCDSLAFVMVLHGCQTRSARQSFDSASQMVLLRSARQTCYGALVLHAFCAQPSSAWFCLLAPNQGFLASFIGNVVLHQAPG